MYFLILSYAIYSFIFSKIFIFFPQESATLLHISLFDIINGVIGFNVGSLLGKLISTFNFNNNKLLTKCLLMMLLINSLTIYGLVQHMYFIIARFVFGVCIGLIITIYLKHISACNSKSHIIYLKLLFNCHLLVLPLWFLLKIFVPMIYWLPIMNIIIVTNIIYLFFCPLGVTTASSYALLKILYIIWHSFSSIYLHLTITISIILFNGLLVLMSHHQCLHYYSLDIIFMSAQVIFGKYTWIFYEQIPFITGGLCLIFSNFLRRYILVLLLPSLLANYFILRSITLYSITNGLIYGLYVVYAVYFANFLKDITFHIFPYGSLLFYILKTLFSFVLQYYLLSYAYKYVVGAYANYFHFNIISVMLISILVLYFIYYLKRKYTR